jgi:hypothetical protein
MLGNIIGSLMSLAISSIVLANVFIPIVKDANTTGFSAGELALWGVVTLIAIAGFVYYTGGVFGLL